jgi:hypothetical protein
MRSIIVFSLLAATFPLNGEFLQMDLSIFGMD